ncbi:MAG: porin [Burkholderiaceae bacterium]|nr:porin [Burkholderiaceae bacterium]
MAENSVTLYGRLSVGYVYESVKIPTDNALINAEVTNPRTGTNNQFEMASSYAPGGSHWGMKGSEDLGNGLKASFALESATINTTNGNWSGFGRLAYLELSKSSWGSVRLGRDYTAGSNMVSGIDPFGASWGFANGNNSMGVISVNQPNMIKYTTPSFSGAQAAISYSTEGTTVYNGDTGAQVSEAAFGTSNKNRYLSIGLRYANGPVLVAGSYDMVSPANNAANTSPKVWMLGGTYDFKVAKLHGAFGQNIDGITSGSPVGDSLGLNGAFGVTVAGSIAAQGVRTTNWLIGASAPVGEAGQVLLSFQQQIPGGDLDQADSSFSTQSIVGLGYLYSMSKRTQLYASVNYVNNLYMLDGVKGTQVGAGIIHRF